VAGRILGLCAAGFLLTLTALASDITGIWSGQLTDRNGDIQDLSFRFNIKDNVLSGKMYGDNESIPIEDARIEGNEITFSVTTELNGSITKFIYSGQINGDELTLVRRRGGVRNNVTAGKPAPENKPNAPQTIKLKHLV
jgi:hypothetical protein